MASETIIRAVTNLEATAAAHSYGSLPDGIVILAADWSGVNLVGATDLKRLPERARMDGQYIMIDGAMITGRAVVLYEQLPETVLVQVVGRRLGEVVRHRLLVGHSHARGQILDAFITWDGRTVLVLDRIFGVADEKARRMADTTLHNLHSETGKEPF